MKANATWAVAECFRFLDSFLYARQEIEKLGKILGFRVKSFGNVKVDDLKYFGGSYRPDLVRFGSLRVRNGMAKRPRIPRRLHPRRRRAHRCWHTVSWERRQNPPPYLPSQLNCSHTCHPSILSIQSGSPNPEYQELIRSPLALRSREASTQWLVRRVPSPLFITR